MAVADLPARFVALPDHRAVVITGIALGGVAEGGIPAPGVGAGKSDTLAQQVQCGVAADSASGGHVVVISVADAGCCVDDDDLQGAEAVADTGELGLDVVGGDDVPVSEVPEVE